MSRNSLAGDYRQHLRIRRLVPFIFVGPVYHNALKNRAALLSPRGLSLALRAIHLVPHLRRVARMCSSMVSGTAYRFRHGSTLCSPTVEKILCRSLIVSALQISPCSPKGKRESQEGRNRRCLPFWFPRRNRRRFPRLEGEKLTLNKRHRTQNEQRQCQRNRTQRRAEHNDRR